MDIKKIGLIAGQGKFPIFFAEGARRNNVEVMAFCIEGLTSPKLEEIVDHCIPIKINEFQKLIQQLMAAGIKHIALCGRVPHAKLLKPENLDHHSRQLLSQVDNKQANSIFKMIKNEFSRIGIQVVDSSMFLEDLKCPGGLLTPNCPISDHEIQDLQFGKEIAPKIAMLDIGQTIAVKNQIIVAIEAIEGTDTLIKRAGELAGQGIVIVKSARPNQDVRFDLPVVGKGTIRSMIEAKARVLAVSEQVTLFFDREEAVRMAVENNISILAF